MLSSKSLLALAREKTRYSVPAVTGNVLSVMAPTVSSLTARVKIAHPGTMLSRAHLLSGDDQGEEEDPPPNVRSKESQVMAILNLVPLPGYFPCPSS